MTQKNHIFEMSVFCLSILIRKVEGGPLSRYYFIVIPGRAGTTSYATIERLKVIFQNQLFQNVVGERREIFVIIS